MNMKHEIYDALATAPWPLTSEELAHKVRVRTGVEWKTSSIRKALGMMVSKGTVVNLDRDRTTGYYHRIPCRYQLAEGAVR